MRKSKLFFLVLGINVIILGLFMVHGKHKRQTSLPALERQAEIVRRLDLTDLCLFTEARYTRHPSQADLHSAFQDHPFSLEHFPAGSFVPVPARVKRHDEKLD